MYFLYLINQLHTLRSGSENTLSRFLLQTLGGIVGRGFQHTRPPHHRTLQLPSSVLITFSTLFCTSFCRTRTFILLLDGSGKAGWQLALLPLGWGYMAILSTTHVLLWLNQCFVANKSKCGRAAAVTQYNSTTFSFISNKTVSNKEKYKSFAGRRSLYGAVAMHASCRSIDFFLGSQKQPSAVLICFQLAPSTLDGGSGHIWR